MQAAVDGAAILANARALAPEIRAPADAIALGAHRVHRKSLVAAGSTILGGDPGPVYF